MRMVAAAISLIGVVYEDSDHYGAIFRAGLTDHGGLSDAYFDLLDNGDIIEGFIDPTGAFFTRDEAADACGCSREDALAEVLI